VYVPDINSAIIGYGIDQQDQVLNDLWQLDLNRLTWSQLPFNCSQISPRTGTAAVLHHNQIYLFGGFSGSEYLADLHVINLVDLSVSRPDVAGAGPSPRIGHIMATWGDQILVWAGYDGDWLADLWILDLREKCWISVPTRYGGRTSAAGAVHGDNLFIFGSTKTEPMLKYHWPTREMKAVRTSGVQPPSELFQHCMVAVDQYLIIAGGKDGDEAFNAIYGFDVFAHKWFVYPVLPDGVTTSMRVGAVDEDGNYLQPRFYSHSMVYRRDYRDLVLFLGAPMMEPPMFGIVQFGASLGVMHAQADILDQLDVAN
jgi:hypothetical protein